MRINAKYERYYLHSGLGFFGTWRHEIRRIVDFTSDQVTYELEIPPTEGTCVGWGEQIIETTSMNRWKQWVALAREIKKEEDEV